MCGPGRVGSPPARRREDGRCCLWHIGRLLCPPLICPCFGAMGRRNENAFHSWLPLPPDFGLSCSLFACFEGRKGSLPSRGAVIPDPSTPVPLDRTASLGSDRKPPVQSLGRSCPCECRVCREWGEERVSPAPLNA